MSGRTILSKILGKSVLAKQQAFLLSQDALAEFESQDVFKTIEEFIDAMPASVKNVHCVELTLSSEQSPYYRQARVANSPEYEWFGMSTFVNDKPDAQGIKTDQHPGPDDSVFDISNPSQDGAYDMAKQQDSPDGESHIDRVDMRDHGAEPTEFSSPDIIQQYPADWPNWQLTDYPYRQKTTPKHSSETTIFDDWWDNLQPKVPLGLRAIRLAIWREERKVAVEQEALADLMMNYFPIRLEPTTKKAMKIDEIARHVTERTRQNAIHCLPSLVRSEPKAGRWTFSVHCGSSGSHIVKVTAKKSGISTDVNKVDILLGCSCPFWKYYGPDYWAHRNGFLEGEPRSNLKSPAVRDPGGKNWLCKHVLSASRLFRNYKIQTARPLLKKPSPPTRAPPTPPRAPRAPAPGAPAQVPSITPGIPPKAGPF